MPHSTTETVPLTPTAAWAHGSPLLLCKESTSSVYWSQFGKKAKEYGIKGLVLVGAHWEVLDDSIRVAAKVNPGRTQLEPAPKAYWENYPINVDVGLAKKVVNLLRNAGFEDVQEDTTYDWHDDTITPTQWMFPEGSPPATVVSLNARFNPIFHIKIGKALRELRKQGILLCGTGGTVHNMYRNNWYPFLTRFDNFQEGSKPAQWAVDFEKSVSDVVANNKGARLAGALLRLTKNPRYKQAHGSDEHFYPLIVIAGALTEEDGYGEKKAQTWELQHMCSDQFVWGSWENLPKLQDAKT